MHTSFMSLLRNEFDKGNAITLDYLYGILAKNPDLKLNSITLKHRIRSAIYSLQKSNEITRVADATYKKSK
jgi:hypothetical protein